MGSYQIAKLSNGLRIIHQYTPNKVAYCGLIIGVGSRDERTDEHGLAHFLEHVFFKGTQRRNATQILRRMDEVGGDLNAYTTKEETCVYSTFLAKDYPRAIELLADLICNSTFPERELEREKQVVIDEIYSYMDNPSEAILDDFEEAIFRGYPIGRKILGSAESVKGLTRSDILSFIERNYTADRMVLSSVGNIKFEKLVALAERFFNGVSSEASPIKRIAPINYEPVHIFNPDDLAQCYYMTGNRAFHQKEKERVALSLLVEMLGGNSMGSRLNLRLREKNGLVYEIESNYTPYSDSGVFSVYFACDSHNLERCIRLCHEEMSKLSEKSLTPSKLERFKAQYKAQMAIASENYEGSMLSNGKSLLVYDKVDELDRIYEKIDALTPNDLRNAAEKIFDPKKLSSVTYGV